MSADIHGGIPANRITTFAGEEATGKTFFVLNILSHYRKMFPDGYILYFDTESAVSKDMFITHNIGTKSLTVDEPITIERFRAKAAAFLEAYAKVKEKRKDDVPKLIVVLDSLGNLSTAKQEKDALDEESPKDMTRASSAKAAFNILSVKYLARLNVPMIVTNHIYSSMSMYAPKEMSGGSGLKYLSSTICFLSKSKDKVDDKIVGNIIKVTLKKSRLTKENSQVEVKLNYERGLDRHYGLLDFASKNLIIPREGNRYKFPDGSLHFSKQIENDPSKYWTPELLDRINEKVKEVFCYKIVGDDDDQGRTDNIESVDEQ